MLEHSQIARSHFAWDFGNDDIWFVRYTGNYSYNTGKEADAERSLWGFRDLIIEGDTLTSRYITPENTVILDGKTVHHAYGVQDEYKREI